MSEMKMNVPEEESFELKKVKITPDGGLDVQYVVEEDNGAEVYKVRNHVVSAKCIHDDLRDLMQALVPVVARVFGYYDELAEETKASGEVALGNYLDRFAGQVSRISVCGLSISGKGENVGAVVVASMSVNAMQCVNLVTPRIKYLSSAYGLEADLEVLAQKIQHEVYLYLFDDKVAEMENIEDFVESEDDDC